MSTNFRDSLSSCSYSLTAGAICIKHTSTSVPKLKAFWHSVELKLILLIRNFGSSERQTSDISLKKVNLPYVEKTDTVVSFMTLDKDWQKVPQSLKTFLKILKASSAFKGFKRSCEVT